MSTWIVAGVALWLIDVAARITVRHLRGRETPPIEFSFRHLHLSDGDRVVLTTYQRVMPDAMEALREKWREVMPEGVKAIVVERAEVSVEREEGE